METEQYYWNRIAELDGLLATMETFHQFYESDINDIYNELNQCWAALESC